MLKLMVKKIFTILCSKILFIYKPVYINSFLASGDFCWLLIIFAKSLDRDQDRHSVHPDLGLNCSTPERFF